jgi:UDP-N-acetylglucosamine diphosphorylase/glucosamine-1-phosphate N-acetyltransferase
VAPGLILFDDLRAREWEPFALTRPVGELRFGAMKLVERAERALRVECLGYLGADHLAEFAEPGARTVLSAPALPTGRDLIFWCARAAPAPGQTLPVPDGPAVYLIEGEPAGLFAPAGYAPDPAFLGELRPPGSVRRYIDVSGRMIEWVWDLLLETPEQLARDLAGVPPTPAAPLPPGVYLQGGHRLRFGRDVRIEPGTLFDTREGPIEIGDEVEIRHGTRLAGPAAVGARSRLLGGSLERISVGPYTYLRGEVADSVVLGYSNKSHDGFLGHAYLGMWVNLGALTTNSDLKNNYGPVRVWTPSGTRDTGRMKVGCFLGDHVKTGIGLLLGTGTVVGAGANLFGSAMPPRYVPPFSWGEGAALSEYRLPEFLASAATVMARRGVETDERWRRHVESCWRKGRGG